METLRVEALPANVENIDSLFLFSGSEIPTPNMQLGHAHLLLLSIVRDDRAAVDDESVGRD